MVTILSAFDPLTQNSCQQIESMPTEMSTRLGYNLVVHRILFCDFQGVNSFLSKISRGETSSDIQNTHLMTKLSPDLHALSGSQNSSFKAWRSMMPRSTMEMNTTDVHSHLSNFLHSFLHFFSSLKVISKFSWKRSRQIVTCIFFDWDSP